MFDEPSVRGAVYHLVAPLSETLGRVLVLGGLVLHPLVRGAELQDHRVVADEVRAAGHDGVREAPKVLDVADRAGHLAELDRPGVVVADDLRDLVDDLVGLLVVPVGLRTDLLLGVGRRRRDDHGRRDGALLCAAVCCCGLSHWALLMRVYRVARYGLLRYTRPERTGWKQNSKKRHKCQCS